MLLYRLKKFLIILILIPLFFGCSRVNNDNINCTNNLISYDWVYPNYENASAAFKFNSDNTFNYSSVFFNITRYGTWEQLDNCSFKLTYQNGDIKTINISNSSFYIGETRYIKY